MQDMELDSGHSFHLCGYHDMRVTLTKLQTWANSILNGITERISVQDVPAVKEWPSHIKPIPSGHAVQAVIEVIVRSQIHIRYSFSGTSTLCESQSSAKPVKTIDKNHQQISSSPDACGCM
jgi:hypothetical protein